MMDAVPQERTRRSVEGAVAKNARIVRTVLSGMCVVTVFAGALWGAGIGIFVGAMCAAPFVVFWIFGHLMTPQSGGIKVVLRDISLMIGSAIAFGFLGHLIGLAFRA